LSSLNHFAIFLNNHTNKDVLIKQIINEYFGLLKGEVYAVSTLNGFIDEELNHGRIAIKTSQNIGLTTMSSGQQKRALIAHLISQKPDYLIIDDVFSNLDQATQTSIAQTLEGIAKDMIVVQLFYRKADLLSFISQVWCCEGNQITQKMDAVYFAEKYQNQIKTLFDLPVPKALGFAQVLPNPLIVFKDVSVNYGDKQVLNKLNWTVNNGDFWQIIGPNGSGKSTILSMITGDNPKAYQQDIILFGRKKGSGESVWEIKKQIGYCNALITQQFARPDSIQNMVVAGFFDQIGLYTKPSELQIKIAQDWLRLLGLFDQKEKPFTVLSLGQQRMTMVARAMIKHPPLLILDEVTAGLDDENVAVFTALINKIASESQTAILYVSHRAELGLNPKLILELTPSQDGSVGKIT
jgi:molybdate transport system ATP-binding protein